MLARRACIAVCFLLAPSCVAQVTGTLNRDLSTTRLDDDDVVYRITRGGGFGSSVLEFQRREENALVVSQRTTYRSLLPAETTTESRTLTLECWFAVERAVDVSGFWTADVLVPRKIEIERTGVTDVFFTRVEGRRGPQQKDLEFFPSFDEHDVEAGDRLVNALDEIADGRSSECGGR